MGTPLFAPEVATERDIRVVPDDSGRVVGNSYVGITSGLPVIRQLRNHRVQQADLQHQFPDVHLALKSTLANERWPQLPPITILITKRAFN